MRGLGLVVALVLALGASPALGQEGLSAESSARYLGDGLWEWTLRLEGPQTVLGGVERVEYLLAPSQRPRRRISEQRHTPQGPFAITTQGWAPFEVPITVRFKDGSEVAFTHALELPRPQAAARRGAGLEVGSEAERIGARRWRWTAFLTGPEERLARVRCVEYLLHPSFPNPVREVCERGSGPQAFPLTFEGYSAFPLQLRVYYEDGRVQTLRHPLRF